MENENKTSRKCLKCNCVLRSKKNDWINRKFCTSCDKMKIKPMTKKQLYLIFDLYKKDVV